MLHTKGFICCRVSNTKVLIHKRLFTNNELRLVFLYLDVLMNNFALSIALKSDHIWRPLLIPHNIFFF